MNLCAAAVLIHNKGLADAGRAAASAVEYAAAGQDHHAEAQRTMAAGARHRLAARLERHMRGCGACSR